MLNAHQRLDGTTWIIDRILGEPTLVGSHPEITFSGNGRVSGNASCNRLMGSVEVADDGGIAFGRIATTLMICGDPAGVMEQEQSLLGALEAADHYEVDESRLVLGGGGTELVTGRLAPDS